jgi:hypothetical protein
MGHAPFITSKYYKPVAPNGAYQLLFARFRILVVETGWYCRAFCSGMRFSQVFCGGVFRSYTVSTLIPGTDCCVPTAHYQKGLQRMLQTFYTYGVMIFDADF